MSPCLATSFVALLSSYSALAWQYPNSSRSAGFPRYPVSGEVVGVPVSERLFVELTDPTHRLLERVNVSANGSFRFFNPPPEEDYEVLLVNDENVVLERVWVRSTDSRPRVRFEPRNWNNPNSQHSAEAGTAISSYRLTHKIPRKARSEFSNAADDYKKKRTGEAVEHLKKAIEIDGGYVEALNILGSHLLELRKPQDAEGYLRKAADLDPASPIPVLNLSLTLMCLGKMDEAEVLARKGVSLDGGSERARKVLELCLRLKTNPGM